MSNSENNSKLPASLNLSRYGWIAFALIFIFTYMVGFAAGYFKAKFDSLGTGCGDWCYREIPSTATPTNSNFAEILIAIQEIKCGSKITADDIHFVPYPEQTIPFGAEDNLDDVVGKYVNIDIPLEMPILVSMLVDDPNHIPQYCR